MLGDSSSYYQLQILRQKMLYKGISLHLNKVILWGTEPLKKANWFWKKSPESKQTPYKFKNCSSCLPTLSGKLPLFWSNDFLAIFSLDPIILDHFDSQSSGKCLICSIFLFPRGFTCFRFAYARFMETFNFKADDRPLVKYVPDFELAYILQRYKETHDFYHTLLLAEDDISVLGEAAVKWFEMTQLNLPVIPTWTLTQNTSLHAYS